MGRYASAIAAIALLAILFVEARQFSVEDVLRLPSEAADLRRGSDDDSVGTRWAILIAGSSGYWNYRHQADVCHAYQIMKNGGLKDENIVVFMYDDIANDWENPRPGTIINHPQGGDVYAGVPKDYVGDAVNVNNFFAVLLGNKTAVTGGSGKVVDSGPNDHIFVFYSDHGGPGVLGMPTYPYLYADDLNEVLKQKYASGSYKSMVFYIEACESGSIFEGLLPEGINIYATTASNAEESSWGTYCPGDFPSPPPEYDTCLGDLYSVAWMEDRFCRHSFLKACHRVLHTLTMQCVPLKMAVGILTVTVKDRTSQHNTYNLGSHVMQYGDIGLSTERLFLYIGSNPANDNSTFIEENKLRSPSMAVNQRDADLVYFWNKYRKSTDGSARKLHAHKQLVEVMSHRLHVDNSMELIGKLLFGSQKGPEILKSVRPAGQPLVDDWGCLKTMVRTFETYCGSLTQYGMKHMRSMANVCNAGVQKEAMAEVASQACARIPDNAYSSLRKGFSA
ncbi:hypothetical protein ACLOJK_040025 [Asimina triloba]